MAREPQPQPSDALRVGPRVAIPRSELEWRFSRSSGPGGQGVNTTDSRVELSFDLMASPSVPQFLKARAAERLKGKLVGGTVTVVASSERSQLQNRQAAERRLAELLLEAFAPPPPPRRKTRPTRSSVEKRISSKKRRGETKRMRGRPEE